MPLLVFLGCRYTPRCRHHSGDIDFDTYRLLEARAALVTAVSHPESTGTGIDVGGDGDTVYGATCYILHVEYRKHTHLQ